jgi:ABC-type multidrug transport system fused ATPase/permease subunit
MQKVNKALIVSAAFLVASCAAFFSVTGLGLLFKSFSVMVMAGCLEYAKLVTAAYVKNRWTELGKLLRVYLSFAVLVLMFVTSMGIYGFLSDAFQNQSIRLDQVDRQIVVIDTKIKINKTEIDRYTQKINNLSNIRNSQEQNLTKLIDGNRGTGRVSSMIKNADLQIINDSKKIDSLNNLNVVLYQNIDSVKNTNMDLEREVGGFRFVAESFNIPLKSAVKWFILMIVFVFDPLAIALVLAYNSKTKTIMQVEQQQQEQEQQEQEQDFNKPKRGRPKKYDKNWIEKLYGVEENKKYAQNGEEAKIEYILNLIGDGKYLVDLGAKDGYSLSNTRYFVEKGYQCLLIDVDSEAGDSKEVKKHKIFSGNVIPLLKTYKCPKVFDMLSIDLNGTDYWVLSEVLKNFQPRLIIAEFNASIPSGKSVCIKNEIDFNWTGDNYFGFSFDAGKKLGQKYGYTVIHQENNMNMFLVKDEYLSGVEAIDVKYEEVHYFKEDGRKDWVEV